MEDEHYYPLEEENQKKDAQSSESIPAQANAPLEPERAGLPRVCFVQSPKTQVTYYVQRQVKGDKGHQASGIFEVVEGMDLAEEQRWALKLFSRSQKSAFLREKERLQRIQSLRTVGEGAFPCIIKLKEAFEDPRTGMGCIVIPLARESLKQRM